MSALDTLAACVAASIAPTTTDAQRAALRNCQSAICIAIIGSDDSTPLGGVVDRNSIVAPPGPPVAASDLSSAAVSAGATLTPAVTLPAVTDWPNAFGQAQRVLDAIQVQYGLSPPGGLSSFLALAGLLPGQALPAPGTDLPFNSVRCGTAFSWYRYALDAANWANLFATYETPADPAGLANAIAAATAYIAGL